MHHTRTTLRFRRKPTWPAKAQALAAALVVGTVVAASTPLADAALLEQSGVLWFADHESDRLQDHYSQFDVSGSANAKIATNVARSGEQSMALTIYNANGEGASPGVRSVLQENLVASDAENLPNGYYSAWYYFPEYVENTWWNVLQWKQGVRLPDGSGTHKLLYFVLLDDNPDGTMTYRLRAAVTPEGEFTSTHHTLQSSSRPVPIGKWTHLECYYEWSMSKTGAIACWQDGVKIFDQTGLHTELDKPYRNQRRIWTINNYANHTSPTSHTFYVDDAAISTLRLGREWRPGDNPGDCAGLTPTIQGTSGDDVLVGTPGRDVIHGRGGSDVIRGRGGNDVICGGAGDDVIRGGPGRDRLHGGYGRDEVHGGRGADRLFGNAGGDILYGQKGEDRLRGGGSADQLFGGRHRDVCVGGPGVDTAGTCEVSKSLG